MIKDDLLATAALAHLDLSEDELTAALPAFEDMLEYFSAMRAADGDGAFAGTSITDSYKNMVAVRIEAFRPDNNNPINNNPNPQNPSSPDDLISNAGERDGNFILVPNVL